MSSLLLKSSIGFMALAGSMLASNASAEVCVHGERSDVRVSVYVQDRLLYVGDANLEATIVPFSAASDEAPPEDGNDPVCEPGELECDEDLAACDPETEPCDGPDNAACEPGDDSCDEMDCDPTIEDCDGTGDECDSDDATCDLSPEAIVEVAGVPVGQQAIVAFTSGKASIEVSVPGFETVVVNRTLCGPSSLTLTLIPSTTSTLVLKVAAASTALSAEGAQVVLIGQGARAGQRFEAVVSNGEVVISEVPAGVYSLEVVQAEGAVSQRISLGSIDLFDDSTVSVRLIASNDLPATKETCSTASGPLTWLASILGLMVLGLRRRLRV